MLAGNIHTREGGTHQGLGTSKGNIVCYTKSCLLQDLSNEGMKQCRETVT